MVKGAFVGRRSRVLPLGLVLVALVSATLVATVESAGAATPTFVQQRSAAPSSGATVTATYQNSQAATDTNVVVVGWDDATSTVSSVTDSAANVYQVAAPLKRGTAISQVIYYAKNIKAAAAGSNKVTVKFNRSVPFPDVRILEYSGLDAASPLDVTVSASGTATAVSTATVTTHSASELLVGAGTTSQRFTAAGSGFTSRVVTGHGNIAEDRTVTATGSYRATGTQNATGAWVMQLATFKASTTTPPTTTTTTSTTTTMPTTTTTGSSDPRAVSGQWAAPVASGGTVMQHAALVPGTSQVLFFEDGANAKLLDTTTGAITPEPAGSNLFCAGQTVLADGRVLVLGGDTAGNPQVGAVNTNIYSPTTGSFSAAAPMHSIRWYPSGTKLPDGRILATGGTHSGVVQQTPEIYNPATNTWTLMSASANLNIAYYPYNFVLPDGRVLEAGSFGAAGIAVQALNVANQTWTTVDSRLIPAGSATMYRPGKVLRTGTPGGPGAAANVASAATYTLDMTSGTGTLQQVASMANPRAFLNLTTLPDGNVLVTGGDRTRDLTTAAGAVYAAEEWSPGTGQWKTLASNQVPRFYHSIAVTLPDGRVLVGGGWGGAGGDSDRQRTYEIYSPPYLFNGARPTITSAPASANYGAGFTVGTPDAAGVSSVVLTAPAALTHNFDENARYVPLNFTAGAGGLQVTAPANANLAPPGPYLLWIVNGKGVPSVAKWITIN